MKDYAKDFKKAISANNYSLSDIGYNAIKRRSHHNHRLAITAKTVDDLIEKLDIFLGNGKEAGIVSGVADNKKITFKLCVYWYGSSMVGDGQRTSSKR